VQTVAREVVRNGGRARGLQLAGVGLGLEPEGQVEIGDVWGGAVDEVSSTDGFGEPFIGGRGVNGRCAMAEGSPHEPTVK
jgi:hypothetical protein